MIPGWLFFTAQRYFSTQRRDRGLAASVLPVLGIAVGVLILTAVLAVMNGFQLSFIENILEVSSNHLRLHSPTGQVLTDQQISALRGLPQVKALTPFLDSQTIARGGYSSLRPTLIRGLPADALAADAGLRQHLKIIEGVWDLENNDRVVLGSELARALGVGVGDEVDLMALSGPDFSLLRPKEVKFTVAGLFKTDYYEFDSNWAFLNLEAAGQNFSRPDELTWGLKLRDEYADAAAAGAVRAAVGEGWTITSWREYNAAFFGALRMEKMTMMFLVGLIFLVVGVNIYFSINRSVLERKEEIGLLMAIGGHPARVRLIFVLEGLLIGLVGAFSGLILGLLVAGNINQIFSLTETVVNTAAAWLQGGNLADGGLSLYSGSFFYIPRIPSRVLFPETFLILLFAVFSAAGAAWLASRKITTIKPAAVLRAE